MLSNKRPYLIKAIYDWLSDNNAKIYIAVNTLYNHIDVPKEAIDAKGYIVLRIEEPACNFIDLTRNDYIDLELRFSGVPHRLHVYYDAIDEIFNPDSKDGLRFQSMPPLEPIETKNPHKGNFLKLVK